MHQLESDLNLAMAAATATQSELQATERELVRAEKECKDLCEARDSAEKSAGKERAPPLTLISIRILNRNWSPDPNPTPSPYL